MAVNNRSLAISYTPAPPPLGDDVPNLSRATWDEFESVRQSLVDLDRPNVLSCRDQELLNVTDVISWQRVLSNNPIVRFENPRNTFDPTTGTFICAQEGVYQVVCTCLVQPFATPQVKSYYVAIRATITSEGGATEFNISYQGGNDNVPLQAQLNFLAPLRKGDTLFFDATVVHEQVTGTTEVLTGLQTFRISGA